tara:strand:+ start:219 stop:527 length:309 start_codon:yes stop_codon:yes gene_type:complete
MRSSQWGRKMVIKLVEVAKMGADISTRSDYVLREIFVNPEQVTMLREDVAMKNLLSEGRLPNELDSRMEFTRVFLNTGMDIFVVGAPHVVESKLKAKQILRG